MALTTSIRDDIRYGFAVGRVRVLETRLLSRGTYERLLDAPDLREQRRVLAETHVGRYLEGAGTAEDIERGLEASLADLYDEFLDKADLPEPVQRYFRIPHDYDNLRLALKARVLRTGERPSLSTLGSAAAGAFAGDGAALPPRLRELFTAFDAAEEPADPDAIESLVDRALFAALGAAATESRLAFLARLTALRVDLANARVLVRSRGRTLLAAQVDERLIDGGNARLRSIARGVAGMSAADLAGALTNTGALGRVEEADVADLERFDALTAARLAARMGEARRAGGAAPVLAYVLGREAEALLLRTVLVGRLAGLDREFVRGRLKERW